MIRYLKAQIDVIKRDSVLSLYGATLALTHVWTYFYWNRNHFFINSQSAINSEPICFPFFPNCDLFRESVSVDSWTLILYSYLALSVLCFVLFLSHKTVGWAFSFLLLVTAFKFALHMSNYNFMGNYHYMVYWVTLVYVFLPEKRSVTKHLIVAFYIAAGFLKINIDWLSGAAMIRSPYIGGNFLVISLFYVVVLELILVFGLLHKQRWVRLFVLAQLLFFHAFSWHIVGFYYPLVMFCLLSVFILDEWKTQRRQNSPPDDLGSFFHRKASRLTYLTLAVFAVLQALPFLMANDPSLSGVPRLSSLNMFDSKTHCHSLLVAHTKQGTIHIRKPMKNLGTRLKCDPLIFLNQAHQLCRKNKESGEIQRLSLSLLSKRVTEQKFKTVLDIKDVCAMDNPLWAELIGGES